MMTQVHTVDVTSSENQPVDRELILHSPVAQGLAIIGDRWAFMIIRDIYLGARQFEELRRRSGAARGTLTSRLKALVRHGILYRNPYQTSPIRHEYRLTDKGLDLYPIVLMIWRWETRWGTGKYLPPELTHKTCGKSLTPRLRCGHCHVDVVPQDMRFEGGTSSATPQEIPPRYQRRSKTRAEHGAEVDQRFFTVLDTLGDRWTSLVIAAAFFGLQRFDEIAYCIGIATNILSDRLKLLVASGILDRIPYQDKPARFEYHLSEKGRDLYAHTVAIHEWADRWLTTKGEKPLILRHRPCGAEFHSEVVCSECGDHVNAQEVTFERGVRNG